MFVETMKQARGTLADDAPLSIGEPAPVEALPETMVFELVEDAKSIVAGGCNRVLLELPGEVQDAGLIGDWEIAIDEAGRFDVTRVDTSLDALCVGFHDPESGALRVIDTGRLAISLTDAETLGIDKARLADVGPLNHGRIDRFSGMVKMTWAVTADSVALAAAGIAPIPAIVPMIGCLDPETGSLSLSGVGEIVDGPLAGAKLQITTKQKTSCRIILKAPAQIAKDKNGDYKATLTVTLRGTPKAPVKISFTARFTPPRNTRASFSPATVTLAKDGQSATTVVTISSARPIQLARFTARGGGKIDKDESLIV